MLRFDDITTENWQKVSDSILKSESTFKESIQTSLDDYSEIFYSGDFIAKVGIFNGDYVGNVIGYVPTDYEMNEFSVKGNKEDYIYLFNFVIDEPFRGKGFGFPFMHEFIKEAKKRGYKKLLGHFRPNGSLALIKKFGAKDISVFKNWEDTGEDYTFCELDIENVKLIELGPIKN